MNVFVKKAKLFFYKWDGKEYGEEQSYYVHFNPNSISINTPRIYKSEKKNPIGKDAKGKNIPSGSGDTTSVASENQNDEYNVSVVRMNMELCFDVSKIYEICKKQKSPWVLTNVLRMAEGAINTAVKVVVGKAASAVMLNEVFEADYSADNAFEVTAIEFASELKTLADVSICNKNLVPAYDKLKEAALDPNGCAVQFKWGNYLEFFGKISSFNVNHTYFSACGEPLRTKISLSIDQMDNGLIKESSNKDDDSTSEALKLEDPTKERLKGLKK